MLTNSFLVSFSFLQCFRKAFIRWFLRSVPLGELALRSFSKIIVRVGAHGRGRGCIVNIIVILYSTSTTVDYSNCTRSADKAKEHLQSDHVQEYQYCTSLRQ